jgi:hypothetical protein
MPALERGIAMDSRAGFAGDAENRGRGNDGMGDRRI